MSTLSAKKVQKLQHMALHGTTGERAAAQNLLKKNGFSSTVHFTPPAQSRPMRRPWSPPPPMGEKKSKRVSSTEFITQMHQDRQRQEEEAFGARIRHRQAREAQFAQQLERERIASIHTQYAQMLAQKQAELESRPPQHYRPHQPIANAEPSPGEANASIFIACLFIAFIIYILTT